MPSPTTKIHQIRYVEAMSEQGKGTELLAVSTEDGRIMFYRTAWEAGTEKRDQSDEDSIPTLSAVGQLGGANEGQTNRIKDFEILSIPDPHDSNTRFAVVSGSSDGKIRIWVLYHSFCQGDFGTNGVPDINGTESLKSKGTKTKKQASAQDPASLSSIGLLLGTYETGNRITCLKAFFMFDATSNDTRD